MVTLIFLLTLIYHIAFPSIIFTVKITMLR